MNKKLFLTIPAGIVAISILTIALSYVNSNKENKKKYKVRFLNDLKVDYQLKIFDLENLTVGQKNALDKELNNDKTNNDNVYNKAVKINNAMNEAKKLLIIILKKWII